MFSCQSGWTAIRIFKHVMPQPLRPLVGKSCLHSFCPRMAPSFQQLTQASLVSLRAYSERMLAKDISPGQKFKENRGPNPDEQTSPFARRRRNELVSEYEASEGGASESAATPQAEREAWMVQKEALKRKFGEEKWSPRKKLSPDAIDGIRALHASQPDVYSTAVLANEFEISPESIRRILKSKWRPSETQLTERRQRWERRGERIWNEKAKHGIKPPKKWRDALGITLRPRDSREGISLSQNRRAVRRNPFRRPDQEDEPGLR